MANTVNAVKSPAGSGTKLLQNTNPEATVLTIVGLGLIDSNVGESPGAVLDASDYPGCLVNHGDPDNLTDGNIDLYWSDGDQWHKLNEQA